MKLNKYFLIGAMGLGLFACSDDLDGNAGQDNGNKVQEGTTYAAFTIKLGNGASSRAIQPTVGTEAEAEGNEADVKNVTIIITNAEDDVIQHVLTTTDMQKNGTVEKYITKTTAGAKKVYAYLNQENAGLPTAESINGTATWKGDTNDKLSKNANELGVYGAKDGNTTPFAMSSVAVSVLNVQDEVTENAALTTNANNVEVTVERVLAKVTVELDGDFETNADVFKLISLEAQIGNPNNLEFSNGALSTTTTGSYRMAQNDENGNRITPYFSYGVTDITWPTENFNFNNDVYKNLVSSDDMHTIRETVGNETVTNSMARFYCLENTHAVGSYMTYNTTFVKLVATMIPVNSLTNLSYSNGVLSGDESTAAESASAETFYEITRAIGTDNSSIIGKYVTVSALAELYEGTEAITTDEKAAEVVKTLNQDGFYFVKYTDGKGYYRIWVNDQENKNGGSDGEVEEGPSTSAAPVFRNDWYAYNITKITLPGDNEDGMEPGPIHPDTHLAVMLKIKAWNKVSHDIVLGE